MRDAADRRREDQEVEPFEPELRGVQTDRTGGLGGSDNDKAA